VDGNRARTDVVSGLLDHLHVDLDHDLLSSP
jgi:hypothetical protein